MSLCYRHDPVCQGGHRRAMADQHQARAGLVQPCAKALAQARFGQQVQPLARLVEQQPGAARQQRAGERDATALATRKPGAVAAEPLIEPIGQRGNDIVGAGKIGAALAQYRGFRQRGFVILAAYDNNPEKIGRTLEGIPVRDIEQLEKDIPRDKADIVVLTVPGDQAQALLDRVVKAGIKAVLNFAPTQLQAPADVTVKTVNMAMELEGLSFALTNRE